MKKVHYEGVNSNVLSELPILIDGSAKVFGRCTIKFVCLLKNFLFAVNQKMIDYTRVNYLK